MIGYRGPDTLYSRSLPQTTLKDQFEGTLIATIIINPVAETVKIERVDDLERKVEE